MAYEIVNSFIDSSLYKLKSPHVMDAEFITIHNTANDATAMNEIAYMKRNTAPTSYHVAIDDKQAIQAIPFKRNAYHAGDGQGKGNRASIGIEICYSKSGGQKYAEAEENTVIYVAHLLKQFGWGIDRVNYHRDWSGKNCPHRIFAEGRADSFKRRIAEHLKVLNNVESVAVKPTGSTSPALQAETDITLASKARREIIVNAAVKEGSNKLWLDKLADGTISDEDFKQLAVKYLIDTNK